MGERNNPRLLYSIPGIKAYHIQDGEEASLTPTGPQTLSLLMVPTSSHHSELSNTVPQNGLPEEDFYLHLNLPPELDLPMPATTQIYHKPPYSYLIPRWDLGPESGAFTRIEFPPIGRGVTQEDIDTFETILAQCTAFLERAPPPKPERPLKQYNPADYAGDGKYAALQHGQIVLVDEDDGSVVGELGADANIHESEFLKHGTKNPVEIEISADGQRVDVRPISEDYLELARNPAYKDSSIVQNAATASRLIVTGSSYIGNILTQGADSFTQKTKPVAKPIEFSPATHDRVRRINALTQGAAGLSAKTVGSATKYAQNFSASMLRKGEKQPSHLDKHGQQKEDYRPGILNKSMIAFSTIADGVAQSGKSLLEQSGAAASTVVGHRYGNEAGDIAQSLAGGVKNVGLVYIDVTGVSRRAIIKSVAKGMVVGKVKGGGQVVVGGGDGGAMSEHEIKQAQQYQNQGKGSGYAPTGTYGSGTNSPISPVSRTGTQSQGPTPGVSRAGTQYQGATPGVSRSGTQYQDPSPNVSRSGTQYQDYKR